MPEAARLAACTISFRFIVPVTMIMVITTSSMGISYATSWETTRAAEMIAYLFRDDHPPSMMAMTLIEPKAKIISSPTFRFRAAELSLNGHHRQAHQRRRHHQHRREAKQGADPTPPDDQLLGQQLKASAMGCNKPAGPTSVRARAALEPGGTFAFDPHQVGGIGSDKGHDPAQVG